MEDLCCDHLPLSAAGTAWSPVLLIPMSVWRDAPADLEEPPPKNGIITRSPLKLDDRTSVALER